VSKHTLPVCVCWFKVSLFHQSADMGRINFFNVQQAKIVLLYKNTWAAIAQSVWRLATGWAVRGSNLGVGEIFRTCPDRPWGPPSLLYNEYRVFPGAKAAGAWQYWPPTLVYRRGLLLRKAPGAIRWASEPVWTGPENLAPTGVRSANRPARSVSRYRLSHPGPSHNR
jgi:hypothetical protein